LPLIARITIAIALALAAGCYSFPTMGRARTVGRGDVELWIVPDALVVVTAGGKGQELGAATRPILAGGVRYGAADRIDLDARAWTAGFSAGPRIQLARSPTPDCGVDVAVAPALALTFPDKPSLELPVLVGWNLPGRHQLVASARVVYQQRYGVGGVNGPIGFAYAGGSIGFVWQVARRFALVPEVAMLAQLYAPPGFASELPDAVAIQTGLGVIWDSSR
jgi:hypothetical protein